MANMRMWSRTGDKKRIMVYRKKRKVICNRCKKLKTEGYFNDVDFGWNVFRKSSWCKVCDSWMDKQRDRDNRKWTKNQNILIRESEQITKIPLIGRSSKLVNGRLIETSPGILK